MCRRVGTPEMIKITQSLSSPAGRRGVQNKNCYKIYPYFLLEAHCTKTLGFQHQFSSSIQEPGLRSGQSAFFIFAADFGQSLPSTVMSSLLPYTPIDPFTLHLPSHSRHPAPPGHSAPGAAGQLPSLAF
uniref:Uncharacterized protein n=1 Tax=Pipistrellus kuhlii TaxID=59472 RepID=A0A7J8A8P1_PIPKU|nr:hypothetical protein mPipKuh1_008987 [Pipistrellus kuhlii]